MHTGSRKKGPPRLARWAPVVALALAATACGNTETPVEASRIPLHLEFTSQPERTFADSVITPQITVVVKDPQGVVASDRGFVVKLDLASNPTGAVLGGTTSAQTVGGIATFGNLRINKAGSGYVLRASVAGSDAPTGATSSMFDLLAAPAVIDSTKLILTSTQAQRGQGTFVFQVTGQAPSLVPGAVITGPQGGGYLRRVRTVALTGSTLTLETDQAALTDVIHQGTLRLSTGLLPQGSAPTPGVQWGPASAQPLAHGVVVNNGVISLDDVTLWSAGPSRLAVTNGSIAFTPQFRLDADFADWRLQSLEARVDGTVTFDADVEFGVHGTVNAELPPLSLATFERSFVTTVAGWPVYGRVILTWELTGSVTATAQATVQSGVTASGGVTIGARYANGGWQSLTAPHTSFGIKPMTVSAEGAATARVGAKARIQVMLYETVGPYLWAEPYLRGNITADIVANRWASTCTSAINAGLGIQAKILDYVLLDFNKSDDFLASSWPICQHSGSLLPPRIERVSGNDQVAHTSSALPSPLVVKVSNPFNGSPMSGVRIGFAADLGEGTVNPSEAVTDAQGLAQTTWTLGLSSGLQTATATIVGSTGSGVTFSATAFGGGTLQGRVFNAATNASISGASIDIRTSSGLLIRHTTTTTAGDWSISGLEAGAYRIDASLPGFVATTISSQAHLPPLTIVEPIPLVPSSPSPGGLSGSLIDAATGLTIRIPVTVELRAGMNATSGAVAASTVTSAGSYAFNAVAAGVYTVSARANGYTNGSRTGIIIGGGTIRTGQDITLSSTGAATSARIVLTWGATPSDLDSHLTGPTSTPNNRFWVYYSARGNCLAAPFACLDVDDITSYGPETITITQVLPGTYRYFVYDYSDLDAPTTTRLGLSGAKVQLYIGNSLVQTFFVPPGAGNAWAVFEWDGQTVRVVNQLYGVSGVPRPAVLGSGAAQPEWMTEGQARLASQPTKRP